jgi:hypothetical protein
MARGGTVVIIKRVPVSGTLDTNVGATGVGSFSVDGARTTGLVATSVTAVDSPSKTPFGPYVVEPIETVFLNSDQQAQDLAEYLASINTFPPQIFDVTIDTGAAANALAIRDVRLNSRVRVTEMVTGIEVVGFVEAIEHRISGGGNKHTCNLLVSMRGALAGVFCSDLDALDGADEYSQFSDTPATSTTSAVFAH